jgi:hypothetical protein
MNLADDLPKLNVCDQLFFGRRQEPGAKGSPCRLRGEESPGLPQQWKLLDKFWQKATQAKLTSAARNLNSIGIFVFPTYFVGITLST